MEKITMKSTVAQALQNPRAVHLAESLKPGVTRHPAIRMVKHMTLEQALKMVPFTVPQERINEVLRRINNEDS